jgi:hypothetical protein
MKTQTNYLLKLMGTAALCCISLAFPLSAATASYTGSLDPTNPNDAFLVSFVVPNPVPVTIQTYGYGGSANAPGGKNAAGRVISPGGFDSYVSIFYGTSASAAFVASNDDGLCPPAVASPFCHDSKLTVVLPAGSYTMALTTFENFSFAENLGNGILGDGFIGFGSYVDPGSATERSSDYAVDIRIPLLVSNQVNVLQTGIARNRSTGLWAATLTVTNTSASPIAGPVQVVLSNLTAGVTMTNNTGVFVYPFITVSPGTLAPGASASVSILFSNPSNGYINYTPVTYSGGLP